MYRWCILLVALCHQVAADTCLSQGELAGVVFGSVFGTLVICIAVAAILFSFLRRPANDKTVSTAEKAAYANAEPSKAERGCDAEYAEKRDKFTLIDSYQLKRKCDFGQQKSFSTENVNETKGEAKVVVDSNGLTGLGFSIHGNMTDGIYVSQVMTQGPASESGNVFVGDRIRSVWISFENMVYEDAVTLLSYSSPYKVKLELERKLDEAEEPIYTGRSARVHPLFRSNSLKHVHFNPVGICPVRVNSEHSNQKFGLPKVAKEPVKEETPEKSVEDEKSYASIENEETPVKQPADTTTKIEENRPETPEKTEEIVPAQEITEINDEEKSKMCKMSSSDYSSTSDVSSMPSDSPIKLSAANSIDNRSIKSVESEEHSIGQTEISDMIERLPTPPLASPPAISPTPPPCQQSKIMPPRATRLCEKPPSPVSTLTRKESPKRSASSPPSSRKTSIPAKKTPTKSRIQPPTARAPEFADVRVSRIPRKDSIKETPVVERKLPRVPSPAEAPEEIKNQKEQTRFEKDPTIWSRLYQEKKGQLRKTREVRAKSEDPIYGTLRRDRRERLTQNDELLEKQMEELRQLGVL